MAPSGRVLIAHPDPLARAYMRGLAESHLRHVDTLQADSFDKLLAQLHADSGIDLALVDSNLPGLASEVGLRVLAERHPRVRVAVLSSALDQDKPAALALDGINGRDATVLPESSLAVLIGEILDGAHQPPQSALHSEPVDRMAPTDARLGHELTGRQRDVLRLLSQGHSNRQIGQVLGIAEGTVKVHVNAAFRLLRVHNRVSAAVACREYFETN